MSWTARFFCFGSLAFILTAVQAKKTTTYPQRTNDDSSLLEWGHSAVIHAADAVVAQFGLKTADQEFELGIEAAPVFAKPSQGCEPLRNAHDVMSQVSGRSGARELSSALGYQYLQKGCVVVAIRVCRHNVAIFMQRVASTVPSQRVSAAP
jgi:hypothetical protein